MTCIQKIVRDFGDNLNSSGELLIPRSGLARRANLDRSAIPGMLSRIRA